MDSRCETLLYIDSNGNKITKPKKKFATLEDAISECKKLNSKENRISKLVSYKCPVCHKFHIGRNGKLIKKGNFEIYKNKY